MRPVTIYDPAKKKHMVVGTYNPETNTFSKKVKPIHFMKKYQAYGIQKEVYDKVQKTQAHVLIESTGVSFHSEAHDWKEKSIVSNEGHGEQRFLPIKCMKRELA